MLKRKKKKSRGNCLDPRRRLATASCSGPHSWALTALLTMALCSQASSHKCPPADIFCCPPTFWLRSDHITKALCTEVPSEIQDFPRGLQKCPGLGLPWWRSGWESACQCRGHRFEPWSGKIPHAAEQLSPWATTTEPTHLEPVLRNKRGHDSERPVHRDEEWPPLAATGESPRTETKTRHSQKWI